MQRVVQDPVDTVAARSVDHWINPDLGGRIAPRPGESKLITGLYASVWLASDDAGFMTGAVLNIDGGYSTR
jgi:NAD(P)-dependent dehydrogenase (short-subunit alcohol dehydrogenase family)